MSSRCRLGESRPIDNFITSRRGFLVAAATCASALIVGTRIERGGMQAMAAQAPEGASLNAFVRIARDNTVTVIIKHLDKGQGVTTGLTTIIADELDADWSQMRSEFAPADPFLYGNRAFLPLLVQGTGGSTSVANSWHQLRHAGAAARALLVDAAATKWGVSPASISIKNGVITHESSGRRAEFGEIVDGVDPKRSLTLGVIEPKQPKDWVHIGRSFPRLDSTAKTTGAATYAMDIRRPGMLTAVIARPPKFGSVLKSYDATAARAIPGVVDVVAIPHETPQHVTWRETLRELAARGPDTWSAIPLEVVDLAKEALGKLAANA